MNRFLFVVPPWVGHINPAVGVAAALAERGHQVAWAGEPMLLQRLAGPHARVFCCDVEPAGHAARRPPELRGPAAFKFLWECVLHPLAEAMLPGVQAAVDRFAPHVLVVDQQALAGALAAERTGLPWATSLATSAELTDPLSGMPKIEAWVHGLMADLRRRFGNPAHVGDLRFSPHLVLAFTTPALVGPTRRLAGPVRFVGPSLDARPGGDDFPWERLDPERPTVLVSLGTVNVTAGARFLTECGLALGKRPDRQAVIVDPAGALAAVPENVVVRPGVPQLRLLPQVDAVICHGGHNTVCEALSHGLPLVVAPIRDDQSIVARQVVTAGAGIRLRFDRAAAGQISAAADAVLTDPSYRQAARRVRQSFRSAGGAAAAARALVDLAADTPQPEHNGGTHGAHDS